MDCGLTRAGGGGGGGERENLSPINSPSSNGSSSSNNNGVQIPISIPIPRPIVNPTARSESANPYPTTFVQADASNFKQVVQMLTGSSEPPDPRPAAPEPPPTHSKNSSSSVIPPIRTGPQKKQGFKLYERRKSLKNGLIISPLISHPGISLPRKPPTPPPPEILSPSMLDFPKLVLSPVTPLRSTGDSVSPSPSAGSYSSPEERAIAEKGFYLHPSPRESEPPPQLLPLFPLASPRVSGGSSP